MSFRRPFLPLFLAGCMALGLNLGSARAASEQKPELWAGGARHQWAQDRQLEMRTLWLDATANLERLSTREGVQNILDKALHAGFNTIGVGVKSPCGFVLYNSRVAPRMKNFMGRFNYPKDYDLLQTVVEEGHKRGMEVHVLVMVFSDGRKVNRSGPAYGPHHMWQSVQYLPGGRRVRQSQAPGGTFVFLNPVLPAVQEYEIAILKEIAGRYNVDGIALDRCRYSGIEADFSDTSRAAFERYIGKKVKRFPQDIYTWSKRGPVPGKHYKKWLEFRASVIGGFVRKAAAAVRKTNPNVLIGASVGSWYPTYSNEGVNWGSRRFNAGKEWTWATPAYRNTGFADVLDYIAPHCYSKYVEIMDAEEAGRPGWRSVQGGAQITRQAVANACWVYGGIYAKDYEGRPDEFLRAIQSVRQETNGIMAFDVSQIEEYGWWPLFQQVFRTPAQPPHRRTGRLANRK